LKLTGVPCSQDERLVDQKVDASLGIEALRKIDLVLDRDAGVAQVAACPEAKNLYANHNRLGALFIPLTDSADFLTAVVASPSPASRADIRTGDVLLRVDEVDTAGWRTNKASLPELRQLLRQPAGARLTVYLKRGDEVLTKKVKLDDILPPRPKRSAGREQAPAPSHSQERSAPALTDSSSNVLPIPFTPQTDESNAALLGRQCALIWFASDSKTFKEDNLENDIVAAAKVAEALGLPYTESRFRSAFRESARKAAIDFDSTLPITLAREKSTKVRDIYLFSYWCTGARAFVDLVPLFRDDTPARRNTGRNFVTAPLIQAEWVTTNYISSVTAELERLEAASASAPLDSFDQSRKFASEVLQVQKLFLSRFLTPDQVAMVTQPLLKPKR